MTWGGAIQLTGRLDLKRMAAMLGAFLDALLDAVRTPGPALMTAAR